MDNATSVAPHAGAWIETSPRKDKAPTFSSRPTRARGLKPCRAGVSAIDKGSRPTRARGLKP
jgi:hypothetical protein